MTQPLTIHTVISQVFGQNTFIAHLPDQDQCIIVDPGLDSTILLEFLAQRKLVPTAILNTHGHMDHIAGNQALKKEWPDCPLVIGAEEFEKLTDPAKNLSAQFGAPMTSPLADVLVNDGDTFSSAGIDLEILAIPGHSRGHVVYLWKGARPWTVFGGDVLFQGSIGRTDFPDGNLEQLLSAIREKLFVLPDDTVVYPGHGDSTTVGEEKQFNPFVGSGE
jgi:hydroxyacylglutathione hydrolase